MRRMAALCCAMTVVAAVTAGCGSNDDGADAASHGDGGIDGELVKIGFIGPLTGPIASTGQASLDGVNAALAYLKSTGTAHGVRYELVVRDTGGDPTKDVAAARELVDQGVTAIVGDISGGTTAAIQPVTTRAKVLSINSNTFGYADQMGTDAQYPYSFADGEDPTAFVEPPAKYFSEEKGAKTVGVLHSADPFGEVEAAAYEKLAASHGIKVVTKSYPPTATDVTAQLTDLQKAGAEAISTYTYSPLPILLSLGKMGWSPPISAPLAVVNPAVLDPAKKSVPDVVENLISAPLPDKMLVDEPGAEASSPVVQGWRTNMEKIVKRPLNGNDTISAYGFDWVMILDGAIKLAESTNTDDLVKALDSGGKVPGARDDYQFGPSPAERQGVPPDRQSAFQASLGCADALCIKVPGS